MLRTREEHRGLIRKHFPEEFYPDDGPGRKLDRRTAVAAFLVTIAKLAVYPMFVWLILDVLAQRYDADSQRVSAAILLSTIVSVVSFPCVAWLALD